MCTSKKNSYNICTSSPQMLYWGWTALILGELGLDSPMKALQHFMGQLALDSCLGCLAAVALRDPCLALL